MTASPVLRHRTPRWRPSSRGGAGYTGAPGASPRWSVDVPTVVIVTVILAILALTAWTVPAPPRPAPAPVARDGRGLAVVGAVP